MPKHSKSLQKPDKYIEAVAMLYEEEKQDKARRKRKIKMNKKIEKENKLQLIPKAENT